MIQAQKPTNEQQRLAALKKLHILETPVEERFERITRIVCKSLNVPICAVSLIDDERQWFKSIQGLEVSETAREVSFCGHTILGSGPFIVEDALKDNRFHDNPLVLNDPNIRFYAGVPIELDDNMRVGTLCAIDNQPRTISQEEIDLLKDLASLVRAELSSMALSAAHVQLVSELKEAERAAHIDPMTRLWNRIGGEKLLDKEWQNATEKYKAFTIAHVNIDHFKQINEKFGRAVGDDVIRCVSRTIIEHLTPSDIVIRWSGQEFMIILPDRQEHDFVQAMEHIIKDIAANQLLVNGGVLDITASIGGYIVNDTRISNIKDTLSQAETTLNQAKSNGRNQFLMG